jgi:hypothetical protein
MQKNSEIRLISLIFIKTRSCLYPMLPFEFGIAGHQLGGLTLVANNAQSIK